MSANPTAQQNVVNGTALVAALPEWKRVLWHDISIAGHARNAFDNDEYDMNGDLSLGSARFAELYTWLVSLARFGPVVRRSKRISPHVLTNMLADCATHRSAF